VSCRGTTSGGSLGAGALATLASLVTFTVATVGAVVLFGESAAEAATRSGAAAVGVAVATDVLRRRDLAYLIPVEPIHLIRQT
jgi:hypothetical protein